MEFKRRTLNQIADMICGNAPEANKFFVYRSSKYLTEFFEDTETDYVHDGSTRQWWVAETLAAILSEPQPDANTPPDTFARVIQHLMDQEDALNEERERPGALEMLNATLAWIGNKLDVLKRSQIMFMERDDILNLFVVTNLPLPRPAWPSASVFSDEPPF